jgi:serine/threonine protein kinase
MKKWCTVPRDKKYIASPFRVPRGSPVLPEMVRRLGDLIEQSLALDAKQEYNCSMHIMHDVMRFYGLELAVTPTDVFSPIPAWTRASSLRDDDSEAFSFSRIVAGKTIAVNNFPQSSKQASLTAREQGSGRRIQEGSTWDRIRKFVSEAEQNACGLQPVEAMPRAAKRLRLVGKVKPSVTAFLPWPPPQVELGGLPSLCALKFDCAPMKVLFKLEAVIGHGTFGTVYQALYGRNGGKVAIKIVQSRSVDDQLAGSELHYLKQLQSAHVVCLYDAFAQPWYQVLVMELMTSDLWTFLEKTPGNYIPFFKARFIVNQLARALAYVHSHSLVHRDLHAKNILVNWKLEKGAGYLPAEAGTLVVIEVKIGDFGKMLTLENTIKGVSMEALTACCGSLSIVAPELAFRSGLKWHVNMLDIVDGVKQNNVCSYGTPVDVWAIGINFLSMMARPPICGSSLLRAAASIVKVFGKIPVGLASRYGWEVPHVYLTTRPEAMYSKSEGQDPFWKKQSGPMMNDMCALDPSSRKTAQELVISTEHSSASSQ